MRDRTLRLFLAALLAVGLIYAFPAAASAQTSGGDEYEDLYEDDGDDYDDDRAAFGIGAGIVLPDQEGRNDGEIYFGANFRWRVFNRDDDSDRYDDDSDYNERYNRRHYRGRYPGYSSGGIRGYIEPEIGYWERSDAGTEAEDLLIGLNLVGVVPTRGADFFLGVGFGLHFIDGQLIRTDSSGSQLFDLGDERLGGNIQVGVEIHLTETLGIFGAGRLDILEDEPFDRQTKIWVGLRFWL